MLFFMSRQDAPRRRDRQADHTSAAAAGAALYGLVSGAVRRIPREVSLTSASTLATLERTGPRRITDLAVIEGVTQPAMTVLVRVLEQSGLVERRGDPTDKRVALVAVTEAGADYVQTRRRAGAEALAQLIDKLPSHEIAALAAAIPALEHLRALDSQGREPPSRSPGSESGVPR
jgi:DNA-binding MarR family transcriptional regulator